MEEVTFPAIPPPNTRKPPRIKYKFMSGRDGGGGVKEGVGIEKRNGSKRPDGYNREAKGEIRDICCRERETQFPGEFLEFRSWVRLLPPPPPSSTKEGMCGWSGWLPDTPMCVPTLKCACVGGGFLCDDLSSSISSLFSMFFCCCLVCLLLAFAVCWCSGGYFFFVCVLCLAILGVLGIRLFLTAWRWERKDGK